LILKVSRSDRIADGRAETAAAGQDPRSSLRSLDLGFFLPSQDLQATSETISRAWRGSVCESFGRFAFGFAFSMSHSVAGSLNIFRPGNVHLEDLHLLSYSFSHLQSLFFGSHQSVAKHL